MKINSSRFSAMLVLSVAMLLTPAGAQDGAQSALQIEGLGPSIALTWSQLLALKHQRVTEKRVLEPASGKSQEVVASSMTGATLADVLNAAGLAKLGRHDQRRAAFVAVAADGYEATFSWAEVFLNESGSGVLVLWERNGSTLLGSEGPLALIALNDARTGPRHVKKLVRLKVLNVNSVNQVN